MQTAKGLRTDRQCAEKIVETLHEPLLVLEPDLRVHSANPAFYRHFGVDPADTVGRRIYDLGNGQWDIPELRELLESVLPENDVFLDYQVVHEFEDIGRRVMLVNGRRLDHAQLILLGIRDETDRRVAEEELREAERRFRTVANLVPDLLWRSRPDGWVTWCNQQWLDYTGQSPEETEGPGWVEAIHPEDRVRARQVFEEARRARSRAETEHRLRRRDGAYRWFLFRADPLLGLDGEIEQWLGSATDVHAQREARDLLEARVEERTSDLRAKEAELVRTTGVLQEEIAERRRAEDARDALSRRVLSAEEEERRRLSLELHDQMGQLLTALTLAVRNLEQRPEGEAIRGELRTIRKLADQIGAEAHEVALVLQPPALDRLGLEASLEGHLEEWCSLRGISCDFQSVGVEDHRFPRLVEITFYRVLQEGLTNVAKHSEAGHVGLLLEYREGTLGLVLEDDGRGFDPDRVLEPAADAGRLGLAGMRQRLALLGGTLEVDSTPGGGTTLLARVQANPVGEGEEGA
jgi:PAS domain S-box-containing protein